MRGDLLYSLRARFLFLVLLAVLPALALVLTADVRNRHLAEVQVRRAALNTAEAAMHEHNQLVQATREKLMALSLSPAIQKGTEEEAGAELSSFLDRCWEYDNVVLANTSGKIVCSARPVEDTFMLLPRPWFQAAITSCVFSTGDYETGLSTNPAMPCASPILDDAGKVENILVATLAPRWLERFAERMNLPPETAITMTDSQGLVLAGHPDESNWRGRRFTRPLSQNHSTVLLRLDEVSRIYASRPLRSNTGATSAVITAGLPHNGFVSAARNNMWNNFLWFVSLLSVAGGIAWFSGEMLILRPLKQLASAIRDLAAGDLESRAHLPYRGEIGMLARSFDRMAASLQRQVTQRRDAEEELRTSRERLRALAGHIEIVREEERKSLSREIHDELGQLLTGIKMDLMWIDKKLAGGLADEDKPQVLERTRETMQLAETTAEKVRDLATRLRPSVLDHLGLVAAIEWQVRAFERRTGIRCEFTTTTDDVRAPLDSDKATAVFRILQETLTNVVRHSEASKVAVKVSEEMWHLVMEVSDNGRGFREEELDNPKSLGLLGIRERAASFGGELQVRTAPGRGTTVIVQIPVR